MKFNVGTINVTLAPLTLTLPLKLMQTCLAHLMQLGEEGEVVSFKLSIELCRWKCNSNRYKILEWQKIRNWNWKLTKRLSRFSIRIRSRQISSVDHKLIRLNTNRFLDFGSLTTKNQKFRFIYPRFLRSDPFPSHPSSSIAAVSVSR